MTSSARLCWILVLAWSLGHNVGDCLIEYIDPEVDIGDFDSIVDSADDVVHTTDGANGTGGFKDDALPGYGGRQ